MEITTWIGNIAAVLTTFSFLPQALQIIKTKDTSGVSLPMYLMFVTGVLFWLCYGFLEKSQPIIMANLVTLTLAGAILFFKINDWVKRSKV